MRRSIILAVVLGALVGVATVAGISLASSGSDSGERSSSAAPANAAQAQPVAKQNRPGRRHGGRGGRGMGFGPMALAVNGLADRLNVSKDDLIDAFHGVKDRALDRAVSEGTITQAQRDALEACMKAHHNGRHERRSHGSKGQRRGSCGRAARQAHRKLHRSMRQRLRNDRDGLKEQLIGDLAAELKKQPDEVEDAVRAEIVELLDTGVKLGFVSDRGRDLALGCFDDPNACDLKALRQEARKHHRGRHGHRGGRGRGHRHP